MSLIKRDSKSPTIGGVFANLKAASKGVAARLNGELVLMLDQSGSMRGEPIHQLNIAARAVIAEHLAKVDINVITFPNVVITPGQGFFQLHARGGTPMRDAINLFYEHSATGSHGILMSDGQPDSDVSCEVEACANKGLVIHTVACGDGADERLLRWIAERTGGTFYRAGEPVQLTEAFLALGRKAIAALTEGRKELAK